VQVGLLAACVLFIQKMSTLFRVERLEDGNGALRFRLYGSLFFGATAKLDPIVEAVEDAPGPPEVVLDTLQLVHLDTSGLDTLRQLHKAVLQRGGRLRLENLQEQPGEMLERSGFGRELAEGLQPDR
jgi:SulP family sulfate permease